jgi:type I restriction enzyme S subunit
MIWHQGNGAGFPVRSLGDVVDFLDSLRRPVKEADRKPGPYPYYGANGQQGTIEAYIFDEPLVLLAEDGGHFWEPHRGVAYRITGKTWVNNHAHVLRPRPGLDLAHLCRVLENYDLSPYVSGTTRGKLTQAAAAKVPIPVPPLRDQRRIAAILDSANDLLRLRERALARLDDLPRSIFIEMFGDPATNPKGWLRKPINQIGTVITGNTPPRSSPEYYGRDIEWIKSDNINTPDYYLTKAKEGLSASGKAVARMAPVGSILVTCIAGSPECIGNAAIADREVAFNQQINAFIPQEGNTDFLYAQILIGKQLIQRASTGGMKGFVSKSRFETISLIFPPVPLQYEFGRCALAIEELRVAQRSSLSKLDALFSSLQHRAFRGELTQEHAVAELAKAG